MIDRRDLILSGGKAAGIVAVAGLTSGFRTEPLPKAYIRGHVESDDPTWDLLSNVQLLPNLQVSASSATFSDSLRRLAGKSFTIRGFMLQLTPDPYLTHFVITRRNTSCAFCPPIEAGEAVEVFVPRRIPFSAHEYSVTGTLALFNNPSQGLYYRLTNAVVRRSS